MFPALALGTALIVLAPESKPAAMVLAARGQVEVRPTRGQPHRAAPKDLLYAGDRLAVPVECEVTLVFLGSGTKERVKPGVEVIIRPDGSTPPESVERLPPVGSAVARTLRNIPLATGGERSAVASFRSDLNPAEPPPAITPIFGAIILSDQPPLTWKSVPDVKEYQVRLSVGGSNRLLWTAQTTERKLAYPAGKDVLRRGRVYVWRVSDPTGRPIVEGKFSVATQEEFQRLAEFLPLSRSADPAEALEAAIAFEANGIDDEALAVYERLTAQWPGEPVYRESLATLHKRAGLGEKANGEPKRGGPIP